MRALLLLVALLTTASAQVVPTVDRPGTIRVTGAAEVRVVPDEAVLRLGVETFDEALERASAQCEAAVAAITDVARRRGVEDTHIRTEHVGIEPLVETHRSGRAVYEVYGYRVRRSVSITLRDLDAFDGLLRDAIAAGATNVHGVSFQTTSLRAHRDEARAQAIDAAREKAEALAARLGQRLGRPTSIAEEPEWWGSSYGSGWGGGYGPQAMQNVVVAGGGAAGPVEVTAPGEIAVRARVAVVFELAD